MTRMDIRCRRMPRRRAIPAARNPVKPPPCRIETVGEGGILDQGAWGPNVGAFVGCPVVNVSLTYRRLLLLLERAQRHSPMSGFHRGTCCMYSPYGSPNFSTRSRSALIMVKWLAPMPTTPAR